MFALKRPIKVFGIFDVALKVVPSTHHFLAFEFLLTLKKQNPIVLILTAFK